MTDNAKHDEFMRLFSQHSRRIFDFISTLVLSTSDAEEVFQNTSLVLWKKFDSYDPNGSFYAWGCKIAYLEVLLLRRSNKRLQILSEDLLTALADEMIDRAEQLNARQKALEACLAKLQDEDKKLVEARYFRKQKPKEMAAAEGISVHAIYRAFVRIHASLRKCVEKSLAKERLA